MKRLREYGMEGDKGRRGKERRGKAKEWKSIRRGKDVRKRKRMTKYDVEGEKEG